VASLHDLVAYSLSSMLLNMSTMFVPSTAAKLLILSWEGMKQDSERTEARKERRDDQRENKDEEGKGKEEKERSEEDGVREHRKDGRSRRKAK
jgi:hypothetical protein